MLKPQVLREAERKSSRKMRSHQEKLEMQVIALWSILTATMSMLTQCKTITLTTIRFWGWAENVEELQDILVDIPSDEEELPSEVDKESKGSKTTQPKSGKSKQVQVEEVKQPPINYDDADYESDKLFAYDSNEEEDDSVDDSAISGSMLGQKRRRGSDD